MKATAIPVLRIFDLKKAEEFYEKWLGFKIEWKFKRKKSDPIYMEVSKDGIRLHLTEHHGDSTPGSGVMVECTGLKKYHKELLAKKYPFNIPTLQDAPWDATIMEVVDPFGNHLTFSEYK